MTPEERQMLTDLANKIAQTPAPQRDPEAEELIRSRIGSRPDALYLMTQTVLIQNMALDHARQEIEQLKRSGTSSGSGSGSFLGAQPVSAPGRPAASPSSPAPSPMLGGGAGMSGFLRSAATTAAGVAAGALAFEGIRSLFGGGFGSEPHLSSSFLGGTPETVINNYYENAPDDSTNADTDDTDQDQADDSTSDDSSDDSYDDSSSSSDDDLV